MTYERQLNQNVVNAKYAVRGRLALRAEEIREDLKRDPKSHPFERVINCNIGNPQQLDQKPITFYRQVLALMQYPALLDDPTAAKAFPADVRQRARTLLDEAGSVGAYSHSKGVPYIRKSVADFIERRDGFPADPENIFLSGGSSMAVTWLIEALAHSETAAYMIPIPQYPLYSATLTLVNAQPVEYFLDEAREWGVNEAEIEQKAIEAKKEGLDIQAMVVINPGNPTGAVLTEDNIRNLIDIAARHNIAIIADEVYQENVFVGEFHSFKKVLCTMQAANPGKYDNVHLASLHSTSKGLIGECGQRGGYMEMYGFDSDVVDSVYKLASINLCSVVTGQALIDLMVNPPREGDESYPLFRKETAAVYDTLRERATRLYNAFQNMEGVTCNEPMGAMYLFPRLNLPESAAQAGRAAGFEQVDEFYCMELLNETGICVIPGSGFGQQPGTLHFRTTFLAPGDDVGDKLVDFHKKFLAKYN